MKIKLRDIRLGQIIPRKTWFKTFLQHPPYGVPDKNSSWAIHNIFLYAGEWSIGFHITHWVAGDRRAGVPNTSWHLSLSNQSYENEEDNPCPAFTQSFELHWEPQRPARGRILKDDKYTETKKYFGYAGRSDYDKCRSEYGLFPFILRYNTPRHDMFWTGTREELDEAWENYRIKQELKKLK